MEYRDVEVSRLIPIQPKLRADSLANLLRNFDKNKLKPPCTIKYNGGFLVANGHNSGYYLFLKGKRIIRIKILTSDEEVANSKEGVLYPKSMTTLKQVIKKYENEWKLECDKHNVHKIEDMLVRSIYRPHHVFQEIACKAVV